MNSFWTTHELRRLDTEYAALSGIALLQRFARHSPRSVYTQACKRGLTRGRKRSFLDWLRVAHEYYAGREQEWKRYREQKEKAEQGIPGDVIRLPEEGRKDTEQG